MLSIAELAKENYQSIELMAADKSSIHYIFDCQIPLRLVKPGVVDILFDPKTGRFFPVYFRHTTIPKVPA